MPDSPTNPEHLAALANDIAARVANPQWARAGVRGCTFCKPVQVHPEYSDTTAA